MNSSQQESHYLQFMQKVNISQQKLLRCLEDLNVCRISAKFVPNLLKEKKKENLLFMSCNSQQFSLISNVKGHLAVIKSAVYRI
jgi:hypothetical protein